MINIRLLIMASITLAAAAIAAVVLAYSIGRWQGSAAERRACEAEIHAGAECDQLAIRYRTLVEVCDVKGNDNKPGD